MDIRERIDTYTPHAIELRRTVHHNPELSGMEYETTALIRKELEEYGIQVKDSGLETGLIADICGKKPGEGKTIAVRADIDALPIQEKTGEPFASGNEGVSHACGHDLHMAAVLLAARTLKDMENEFSGRVRLLFQPAEENGNGAKTMLAHGALEDPKPDAMLGVHTWPDTPAGMVGIKPGSSHASSDIIVIKVKGRGGHGAHPYRCVDPIIVSAYLLTQLQTLVSRELPMVESAVLTFGMIRGGTAANVIPDEVELQGTLRCLNAEWRQKLLDSIKRVSEDCCCAMRAEAEVSFKEGMPPLVNNVEMIEKLAVSADKVLGPDHVHRLPNASPGSDDFAVYLEQVPGILFRMGTGNNDPPTHVGLHNGGNRFDERGIPTAAAVMVQYIMDYLSEN